MSKNTDTQNLLVNVFRPVYTYETPAGGSTPVFKSKIILTNIDTVYANTIAATNYQVGDSNNNLYLGCNAGNTADNTNACTNVVGIGASAASNVSNVSNSTYLGTAAGAGATNASNVIGIGTSVNGNGVNNVYIGNATGNIGSNNIFIGHSNAPSGTINNTLRVGKTLIGDLSANKLGIGMTPTYQLDVSGTTRVSSNVTVGMTPCNAHSLDISGYSYFKGGVGINADPLDHTLSVNGDLFVSDGNARYYFKQDASQNSVFTVESLDPTKKAVFVIHGDISADNVLFNTETYSNLTITGTMKSADVSATSFRVQDLIATTFTAGTFGANDLSAGTLTATHVNALSDISAGAINTTNFSVGLMKATDVSAVTGRFTTIYANDICSSSTVVVPNISVAGDISATGNLYALGFIGTDVSSTTAEIGTLYTNPNTANLVGGVTLSNTNLTLAGTITGNTVNTSNVIGGVVLSNNNVSNSGTHTSSNFIGTSSASNSIGGVTLSNTNISLNGTITGNTANTSNVIGGVVLSNNNVSNSGTHTSTNVISSGYLRNALTPSTWDISGGNISNSGTHTSSNFIGTASASNSIGGVTLSNSNVNTTNILASGYIRNALTPSQFDISGGNLYIQSNIKTGTITATGDISTNGTFYGNYVASSVTSSNLVVSGYLRNGVTPSQFDISGGNISNSATHTSSNFIGTSSASNQIGGVTLSNTNLSLAGTITGSTANTSNVIGGITLSNGNISNAVGSSNTIGGTIISNGLITANNGTPANPGFKFSSDASTGIYLQNVGGMDITAAGVRVGTFTSSSSTFSNSILSSASSLSNSIGGVTLSNSSISTTNALLSGYLRNALTPTTWDISGGNISNSATTRSSNFIGTASASNSIGGVTLSNSRLGVNTITPVVPMDVSGRVRILQDGSTSLTSYGLNNNADTLILQHSGSYATAADLNKSVSILFANATSNNPQARIASEMTSVTPGAFGANLIFQTNGVGVTPLAERMRIDSNGNVGINKTTPLQIFHVGGAAQFDTSLIVASSSSRLLSNDGIFTLSNIHTDAGAFIGVDESQYMGVGTTSKLISSRQGQTGLYIVRDAASSSSLTIQTYNAGTTAERVRFQYDGKVGFGTTSPQTTIDVSGGGIQIYGLANNNSNSRPTLTTGTTAPDYEYRVRSFAGDDGFMRIRAGGYTATNQASYIDLTGFNNSVTDMQRNIVFGTAGVERLRIDSNGNVGIGTKAASYPLDISAAPGTAAVNMSTWSRAPISNCLLMKGVAGYITNAPYYTTVSQTIDSNIAEFSNDTTNGAWFRIKKSGIYTVFSTLAGSSSVADSTKLTLDVSAIGNGTWGSGGGFIQQHGAWTQTLNVTTYFQSNTTTNGYWKIKHSASSGSTSNMARFGLIFHYEMPDLGSGTFPN